MYKHLVSLYLQFHRKQDVGGAATVAAAGANLGCHVAVQDHEILTHLGWYLDLLLNQLYSGRMRSMQHNHSYLATHTHHDHMYWLFVVM